MLFDCQSNLGLASTNDDPIGGTEPDDPNYTEYLGKTGGPIFNPFATIQVEINREYDVIKVYPNPTKGILNIYSENSKIIKIKVWNMSGKLVLEENETTRLNITNRGVYLISITTEKSTQIRKIFVG